MIPSLFLLRLKVIPITNPTAKANCKALTGGNLKKEFNNTIICSAALENVSMIGIGGGSIAPTNLPYDKSLQPPTSAPEYTWYSEYLLKLLRWRVCRNLPYLIHS